MIPTNRLTKLFAQLEVEQVPERVLMIAQEINRILGGRADLIRITLLGRWQEENRSGTAGTMGYD
jgi:hypothetical protein